MTRTYREEFPIGTRVTVEADQSEGTDYEFTGLSGTIVGYGPFLAIQFDRLPRYWNNNPVLISLHNLRHAVANGDFDVQGG